MTRLLILKMNTLPQNHFILLIKLVNNALIYISLVLVLIPYLLTFHWTKLLILALIVRTKMMRIALRSIRMFFATWLRWSPKNRILWLTTNYINKLMVRLWGLHWLQLQLIFLCAVLKINGSKTALIVWSLSSIDGMLIIYLYCFPLSIKQKSLKSIYLRNTPT